MEDAARASKSAGTARFPTLVIRKLPKPPEDGAAIGIAVATQNIDQPDATLLRELEPDGKDVYRPIDKGSAGPQMMNPRMMNRRMFNPFGNPAPCRPSRSVTPSRAGQAIRLEFRRQGQSLHFRSSTKWPKSHVRSARSTPWPGRHRGGELFVANRNGAEPVDVLFRDLVVHADRVTGLGTTVRTIQGTDLHGEPTALEGGVLVVVDASPAPGPRDPLAGNAPTAAIVDLPDQVFAPPTTLPVRLASGGVVADLPDQVFQPAPGAQANRGPKIKARIRLDEVESIIFERASMLAVKYVGQPNVDTTGPGGAPGKDAKDEQKGTGDDLSAPPPGTVPIVQMPKVEPKPNGIRDIHLAIRACRRCHPAAHDPVPHRQGPGDVAA